MNSEEQLESKVYEKLKDILSEDNYGYASDVVTYSEMEGLEFNYTGMAEFRDALTHIKRAIFTNEEAKAMEELNSAFEHIRRAAVESMEEYIETKYANIRKRIDYPTYTLWQMSFSRPDRRLVMDFERIIKENIRLGRESKPKKEWQKAIGYFKKAEDELINLDRIVPTIDEINRRLFMSIQIAIILIIGFILGQAYRLW